MVSSKRGLRHALRFRFAIGIKEGVDSSRMLSKIKAALLRVGVLKRGDDLCTAM